MFFQTRPSAKAGEEHHQDVCKSCLRSQFMTLFTCQKVAALFIYYAQMHAPQPTVYMHCEKVDIPDGIKAICSPKSSEYHIMTSRLASCKLTGQHDRLLL